MKKLALMLILVVVTMTSCHKDDVQQPNDKRLKQIITVAYSDNGGYFTTGEVYTTNYVWEDSLLVSAGQAIHYDGDTISLGYLKAIKRNGRIEEIYNTDPEALHFHWTYSYNSEGKIESIEEMCDICLPITTTYTWNNGNILRAHTEYYSSDLPNELHEYDTYYTYDDKQTPFKGMEDIGLILAAQGAINKNNILTSVTMTDYDTTSIIRNYTYKGNYPVIEYSQTITSNPLNTTIPTKFYIVYMDGTSANIPQFCTITVDANRYTEAGYKARGSGTYEYGATVILQAFERDFIRWDDGNTDNPRTVIARGDATYTAIYTDK